MALYYTSKAEIEKIECEDDIYNIQDQVNPKYEGETLPEKLVTDNLFFRELYELWIRFVVEQIVGKEVYKKNEEKLRNLFFENQEDDYVITEFIECYSGWMSNVNHRYCDEDDCLEIKTAIEKSSLKDLPKYMMLRVFSVCVLCNAMPNSLFEHGDRWDDCIYNILNPNQNDYLEVENGFEFLLDLCRDKEISKLYPRTLRNNSDKECTIYVSYKENKKAICLPPYGILRVVFADCECNCMISIKGNITLGRYPWALGQLGGKDGLNIQRYHKQKGRLAVKNIDECIDVSMDGEDGVVFLTNRKLYSTRGLEETDNLPIRCYNSGRDWAWLYEDGTMKISLGNTTKVKNGVIAVAEDANNGLLICMQDRVVDYRTGYEKTITEQEFVDVMLGRFGNSETDNYIECAIGVYMKMSINRNGKLEE